MQRWSSAPGSGRPCSFPTGAARRSAAMSSVGKQKVGVRVTHCLSEPAAAHHWTVVQALAKAIAKKPQSNP